MPKISGRVLLSVSSDSGNRLPAGIVYVVPTPGAPVDGLQRLDPQDLAVEVVRVARGALRVPEGAAGALVDRVEAVGVERVRVVAGRDVEAAVGAEVQRAGGVAALRVWCVKVRIFCSDVRSSVSPLTLKRETTCVSVLSGSCE